MKPKKDIKKKVFGGTTKFILACFFLIAVIFPLARMLVNLGGANVREILSRQQTVDAIIRSVKVSLTAAFLSVTLAGIAAWCVNRTGVRLKALFNILLIVPMLIPSISHGTGLVILLGSNGIITRLLGLSNDIYGFWGIVLGSMMYAFPIAYLMLADILKYEDSTPYEAAQTLGIPVINRFSAITLPYLKKPLISVVFAVFTAIVTDYGVPLMVGGMYKTLPVLMYEEVIGRLDFSKGSVFGVVLLFPAVIAFAVDTLCKTRASAGGVSKEFKPSKNTARDAVSYILLSLISLCVLVPVISFLPVAFSANYPIDMTFTLENIETVIISKGGWRFLINSLVIGLIVSFIGTFTAFICAWVTARMRGVGSGLLHLLSIVSLAIPGMVLGISYVLFFKGSFLTGTFVILIMANTVHFFASPYLMIYNSLGKLNPNLEAVGATLGIKTFRLLRDVVIPQAKSTLLEMFSYFFVNSMMTISAVAFLATKNTKPFSLMLTEFQASQTLMAPAAFVSLVILFINLLMKGIIHLIKKSTDNKRRGRKTEYAD